MPGVDEEDANPNTGQESNLKEDSKSSRDDIEVELGKRSSSDEVHTSLLVHFDVLRFKNTFFEYFGVKVVNSETEERLQAVMTQKHELELRLDEAFLKASTTAEHQAAVELEGTRRHEEQMRSIEEEKNKLIVLNEARERELKALKDEIRALHMTKYTLSKQAQEQERQLQLQCTSRETYVTLVNHLEEKCVQVTQRVTEVSEQIEKVEANVKEAVRLNNNLMLANHHQKCSLARCQQDLELCRRELQQARAQHSSSQSSELALNGDTSRVRSAEQELKMQIELNRQLQNQLLQLRDEHQSIIQSLRDAHVLIERHTESCVKMAANEAGLQEELDSKQDRLNALEENLKASSIMCDTLEDTLNQQRQKHADVSHRLVTLQSEYTSLETRYELLETSKMDIAKELADIRDSPQQLKAVIEHMREEMAREKESAAKLEQEMANLQSEVRRLEDELQLEKREVLRLEDELQLERRENSILKAADMQHCGNVPSDPSLKDVLSDSHHQDVTSDMSQDMISDNMPNVSSKGVPFGPSGYQGPSNLQGTPDPQGLSSLQGPSDPEGLSNNQGTPDPQGLSDLHQLQKSLDCQGSPDLLRSSKLNIVECNVKPIVDVKFHGLTLPPPRPLPPQHSTVPLSRDLNISEGAVNQLSIPTLPSLALHLHKIRLLTSRSTTTSTHNTTSTIVPSSHPITLTNTNKPQCGDIPEPQCGDIAKPQCGDIAKPKCGDITCGDIPEPQCGDIPEPQCGDIPEPQCGDIAEPQCGDIAEPQCGDIAEPQCGDIPCGDIPEPQCGDIPEPQCGDIAKPQCGDIAKPQCGDILEPQCGDITKPQCGDIAKPQCGDILEPQCGDITKPQCGDIAKPQCGDIPEPQCGDIAKPQCGDIAKPQCGDILEPQCGDITKPQCGDIAKPQCGDIPEPQCGDIAKPQCGDIAKPQCGDILEPQCGDIPEPQCGDIAEPQFSLKNIHPMKPNLIVPCDASDAESETNCSISLSSVYESSSVSAQTSVCRVGLGTHSDHQLLKCAYLDGLQSACTSETNQGPILPHTLPIKLGAVKRPSPDAEQCSPKKARLDQHTPIMAGISICASNEAMPFSSQPESVTTDGVQNSLSFPDDDDDDEVQSYISKQIGKVASFLRGDRLRRPRKITEVCRIKP
eukprot:Em0005g1657a